ncbi:PIG-L deacetylase family protein [Sphingomonas faeni]|uniref:PIG-L deacetylase family protein n=1 Tax=Sphingomonas faeni TaxID=185950 RepID=UPI0020BFE7B5|nr:PIG-L family deacetylase [Sphingomonas faeni]MCK8455576.1 PIG-L family deacetylase [Sphingomonas faeni]
MKLLAISPHLDDAAFSAGGLLASRVDQGWDVTVATCFTGNVAQPTGFALACQLDKGLGADVDYMALRRAEDHAACAALGARAVHLPFLEAPHRGYTSAAMLFAARLPDDRIVDDVATALTGLLAAERPDLVLGPLCLGHHVDHHVVLDAMRQTCAAQAVLLWEDWPYADREARVAAEPAVIERLTPETRARRIAACAAYTSQLGFQFGGVEAMIERTGRIAEERYYALQGPVSGVI